MAWTEEKEAQLQKLIAEKKLQEQEVIRRELATQLYKLANFLNRSGMVADGLILKLENDYFPGLEDFSPVSRELVGRWVKIYIPKTMLDQLSQ
jgi:hypothetical protein